jgi:hypothetical protein
MKFHLLKSIELTAESPDENTARFVEFPEKYEAFHAGECGLSD